MRARLRLILQAIQEWLNPYPWARRVIVHTRSKQSIRGVLWGQKGGYLILRNAELLEHGKAIPLDGETVVDRSNVDFMQVFE